MITLIIMHALFVDAESDVDPDSGTRPGGDYSSSSPA
jgi:hypothetical protein